MNDFFKTLLLFTFLGFSNSVFSMEDQEKRLVQHPSKPEIKKYYNSLFKIFQDKYKSKKFESTNLYEILGIDQSSTVEDINRAFRQLSPKLHPDKNPNNLKAEQNFQNLNNAKEILTNPFSRAIYDFSLTETFSNIIKREMEEIRRYHSANYLNNNEEELKKALKEQYKKIFEFCLELYASFSKSSPKIILLQDLFFFIKELERISILGSTNAKKIKAISNSGSNIHFISMAMTIPRFIWEKTQADVNKILPFYLFQDFRKEDIINKVYLPIARLLSVIPHFAAFKFYNKDKEIFKNAKKIAKYNKETKRDLSKEKFKQSLWLMLNKLLPYSLYAGLEIQKGKNFTELFKSDENGLPFERNRTILYIINKCANVSEIIRKNKRYQLEVGNY